MKLKEYQSGAYKQQFEYKSFSPNTINHEWVWDDPMINVLLEEATGALGELNAYTVIVPNVDIYVKMLVIKEATTSSRIEGTRTEMDEVLMSLEDIQPENRDDWEEVQNYIKAMNTAIIELEKLPLSNRLIKKTHKILMSGVRGKNKNPGEFRRSQNWIGGATLKDAYFIPPGHDEVPELMSDLEKFWHNRSIHVPNLIRVAVSHYQFETVHPFLDGNGRIGRLMITLYLVSKGLLSKPSLYLSAYLEKYKDAYYNALTTVRSTDDMGHWLKFFLNAVAHSAKSSKESFNKIFELRENIDKKIMKLGRRAVNGKRLVNHLFLSPLVDAKKIASVLGVSKKTASELINLFMRLDILVEITGKQRKRIFLFKDYMNIFLKNVDEDADNR